MSKLNFEYVPLTFISNKEEIKKQIKNTLILIYLFEKYNDPTPLKNLIEGTQYGYNGSALQSGQNKFLRISDIHESKVDWETVPYCNCDDEETYLLKNEDILIARTGGTTGKSFKIETPPPHSIYAGYLIRIRAKQNVNPDYLYLFLHSFAYWSQIVNLNEGNFRPKANAENLKALILPNCSKNIQDDAVRISQGENLPGYEELFDKIEKVLAEYEKTQKIEELFADQLTELENLNKAILQEAVQGKLVAQDSNDELVTVLLKRVKTEKSKSRKKEKPLPPIKPEEIPFDIPENWAWCKIDELVYNQKEDVRTGPFGTALNKGEHKKTGIPVWGIESISKNGLFTNKNKIFVTETKAIELKSFGVKGGDLIISRSGTIGELCMLPYDIHFGLLSTNLMKISVNRDVIMPEYFCHIIKSGGYIDDMLKEFCTGSTRLFLTQNILNRLIFPLPPLSEQKRIVAEISTQFEKTRQLKEHIIANQQDTEQLLKALLHGAFEMEEKKEEAKDVQVIEFKPRICNLAERTVLAAYLIKQFNSNGFGRVMLMKLLYLIEHVCKLDFNSHYKIKVAGPYDDYLIKEIELTLNKYQLYHSIQDKCDKKQVHYLPLGGVNNIEELFIENFSTETTEINQFVSKFRSSTWDHCEIIATLYAVWNNRIIRNEVITDDFLKQDFLDWDPNKEKYRDRLNESLVWMRKKEIVPDGWGKLVERPES